MLAQRPQAFSFKHSPEKWHRRPCAGCKLLSILIVQAPKHSVSAFSPKSAIVELTASEIEGAVHRKLLENATRNRRDLRKMAHRTRSPVNPVILQPGHLEREGWPDPSFLHHGE